MSHHDPRERTNNEREHENGQEQLNLSSIVLPELVHRQPQTTTALTLISNLSSPHGRELLIRFVSSLVLAMETLLSKEESVGFAGLLGLALASPALGAVWGELCHGEESCEL